MQLKVRGTPFSASLGGIASALANLTIAIVGDRLQADIFLTILVASVVSFGIAYWAIVA